MGDATDDVARIMRVNDESCMTLEQGVYVTRDA